MHVFSVYIYVPTSLDMNSICASYIGIESLSPTSITTEVQDFVPLVGKIVVSSKALRRVDFPSPESPVKPIVQTGKQASFFKEAAAVLGMENHLL